MTPPEGLTDSLTVQIETELLARHPVSLHPERARNYAEVAAFVVAPLIANAVNEVHMSYQVGDGYERGYEHGAATAAKYKQRAEEAEADAERLAEALRSIGERSDLYVPIANHNWRTALKWGQNALAAHEARKATA